MAFKSLFGNIFKEKDEGPSVEEIDAEVEAAVRSISDSHQADIKADKVLETGWGEPGDMVYIMSLTPIYTILGSRIGRTATHLRDTSKEVFKKYVKPRNGQCSFVGDNFFMRFYTLGESEGYHRAAVITNEIGAAILGDRFEKVDVPDLVIAAETRDITNEDGTINLAKSEAQIKSGGARVDKTPKDRLKNVHVAFYPTWSPVEEAVGAYACYARRKTSRGPVYGNAVYPELPSDPLSILIDGKLSKLAVRDMATLAHFNWNVDLFLPLRFATLRSKQVAGIAKILADINPAWRKKHLIIEISSVPARATADHLKPLVEWSRSQGRAAAVRTSFASPKLDRIAGSGASHVCFDFEETKSRPPNFAEYVTQAHHSGLQAALWNVSENGALENLIAAKFNLLNGSAVVEPVGAVDNRRELSRNHVLMGY